LEKRRGKLEGIVISGGEPTIHPDLPEFIKKIREMGYAIKLDTNGTRPEVIQYLLDEKLVDYFAMDIKAPLSSYQKAVGIFVDVGSIRQSIILLLQSTVEYEFRTTIVPGIHHLEDCALMAQEIKGAKRYILQKFRSGHTLVPSFSEGMTYTDEDMEEFCAMARPFVQECSWR
jgi:pyruvate formate lyase activating enzyme